MNGKSLLGALLLLHVLLHPVTHAFLPLGAGRLAAEPLSGENQGAASSVVLGPCLGCRTGASLVAAPAVSLLSPDSASAQKLPLATYWPLNSSYRVEAPARAPPLALTA